MLVIESIRPPPPAVVAEVAADCGVVADRLTLIFAPTAKPRRRRAGRGTRARGRSAQGPRAQLPARPHRRGRARAAAPAASRFCQGDGTHQRRHHLRRPRASFRDAARWTRRRRSPSAAEPRLARLRRAPSPRSSSASAAISTRSTPCSSARPRSSSPRSKRATASMPARSTRASRCLFRLKNRAPSGRRVDPRGDLAVAVVGHRRGRPRALPDQEARQSGRAGELRRPAPLRCSRRVIRAAFAAGFRLPPARWRHRARHRGGSFEAVTRGSASCTRCGSSASRLERRPRHRALRRQIHDELPARTGRPSDTRHLGGRRALGGATHRAARDARGPARAEAALRLAGRGLRLIRIRERSPRGERGRGRLLSCSASSAGPAPEHSDFRASRLARQRVARHAAARGALDHQREAGRPPGARSSSARRLAELAVRAAAAVGADFAGVDIMRRQRRAALCARGELACRPGAGCKCDERRHRRRRSRATSSACCANAAPPAAPGDGSRRAIAAAFEDACRDELEAPKPRQRACLRRRACMTVEDFRLAAPQAPPLSSRKPARASVSAYLEQSGDLRGASVKTSISASSFSARRSRRRRKRVSLICARLSRACWRPRSGRCPPRLRGDPCALLRAGSGKRRGTTSARRRPFLCARPWRRPRARPHRAPVRERIY